jgi:PPM family protein phosphatase
MTVFRAGSATDVGRVRSNNQDSHLVRDGELFAVADGMGGHQGGEVASATALAILGDAYDDASTPTLIGAVRSANQAVFDKASADPDLKGMGTTLTALADVVTPEGRRLAIVNVGDSRLYRVRDGGIEQLTEDHSLVASLVRQGRITPEEAESHPQRNILTRALGIDEAVAVDSWEVEPVVGDRYLICSDGLFNEVHQNKMVATLGQYDDPTEAADELVRLANEGGGRDNITAVVVDVLSLDDQAPPTAAVPVVDDDPDDTLQREAVPPDVPPPDDGDVRSDGADGEPKARRFTWRVFVFLLALVLLVVVVVGALGWYARNTYFVTIEDEQVVIFKGRPGGFLWFDPTVEQETGIDAADVPEAVLPDLEDGVDQGTLGDAENYVANLEDQIAQQDDVTSPTTTTTEPATTTTKPERAGGGGSGGGANSTGTG